MKNYSITYICFVALTISNFITAETYKIAFGSCLDQDYPQPIWQSIKNENINGIWCEIDTQQDLEIAKKIFK